MVTPLVWNVGKGLYVLITHTTVQGVKRLLRYLNVKEGDIVGYSMGKVPGTAPYLVIGQPFDLYVNYNAGDWNNSSRIAYHDSNSPIEFEAWAKQPICDFLRQNPSDDFIFSYNTDNLVFANYKNLKVMYQERLQQQVDKIISTLDYSRVKVDQKDEFFKGMRLLKINPTVGLAVCMSAYEFDKFEVNWGDPRTYYNGVMAALGLFKGFL